MCVIKNLAVGVHTRGSTSNSRTFEGFWGLFSRTFREHFHDKMPTVTLCNANNKAFVSNSCPSNFSDVRNIYQNVIITYKETIMWIQFWMCIYFLFHMYSDKIKRCFIKLCCYLSRLDTMACTHPWFTLGGNTKYMNPSRATIPLIRPHQCDSEGGRIRGVLPYNQSRSIASRSHNDVAELSQKCEY